MRSTTGVRRHSINARSAASTAAFTSVAGESGTSASTLADAGSITFSASFALDARHPPSTKFCNRSILFFSLEEIPFALTRFFIARSRLAHALKLRNFRYRNIPPGFITRHAGRRIRFHHDHRGAVQRLGFLEGLLQLIQRTSL